MFLKNTQTVICSILSEEKNLSIQQLYDSVIKHGINISLPNFYKVVAKLIDEQIIVKKNMTLELHGMRVQYTVMLADKIKLHYIQDDTIHIEKLKP